MPISLVEKQITLNNKLARYYQLETGCSKDKGYAHFYGGNGFAVGVYQPFFDCLSSKFNISSLAMRGYWYDQPDIKHGKSALEREQDADFLIDFLQNTLADREGKPVIGIGHSQGATATAMAAAKRPDLFSALYLIEPVTFAKKQKILYDLTPRFIKMLNEPFKSTVQKRKHWSSIEDYYQYLRNHRAYKRISDEHLQIYAKNSLVQDSQSEFELLFSPEQELANYLGKSPFIDDALAILNKTDVYYHVFLGKPSMFSSEKVRQTWQSFVPNELLTILPEYGHLLPMEAPKMLAEQLLTLGEN